MMTPSACVVDVPGVAGSFTGAYTLAAPADLTELTFLVDRQQAGQPVTVPMIVTDDCGAWETFVGAGPGATW